MAGRHKQFGYKCTSRWPCLNKHQVVVTRIPFDVHDIVWRAKPERLLLFSDEATVPVMVLPGEQVIDDELVHCRMGVE
jgi:hypothetical protein